MGAPAVANRSPALLRAPSITATSREPSSTVGARGRLPATLSSRRLVCAHDCPFGTYRPKGARDHDSCAGAGDLVPGRPSTVILAARPPGACVPSPRSSSRSAADPQHDAPVLESTWQNGRNTKACATCRSVIRPLSTGSHPEQLPGWGTASKIRRVDLADRPVSHRRAIAKSAHRTVGLGQPPPVPFSGGVVLTHNGQPFDPRRVRDPSLVECRSKT